MGCKSGVTKNAPLLGNVPFVESSSPEKALPTAVLGLLAAVHGAVMALRLPPRLVFESDAITTRLAYGLAVFALMQAISLPVWGAFTDRFGRQKVIIYSLSATVIAAMLGLSQTLGLRLPQQFVFAVFNGLAVAGLPLALAYSFSLIKEGTRHLVLGWIVSGFFLGAAVMTLFRLWTFSLPRQSLAVSSALMVLFLAGAVLASVVYFLPEARATSVSFTGMNSMHGLWHGFGESNRATFARWWKAFLAFSGFASGLIMMTLVGLADRIDASATRGISFADIAPLLGCFMSAALFALAAAWVLSARSHALRLIVLCGAGASVSAALVGFLLQDQNYLLLITASAACGAGMGCVLVAGIIHYAEAARQRSAGAELGAVVVFWLVALLLGVWLALMTFKDGRQAVPAIAAFSSALSAFAGFMATRRSA